MDFQKCVIFFTCLLQTLHLSSQREYTPVVMEYTPSLSTSSNILEYKHFIEKAAKTFAADIIVFPEATLSTIKGRGSLVPNPEDGIIPYKDEAYKDYNVIVSMSEAAAQHNIYVVVNLHERVNCENTSTCPKRGYFAYNTNVAFDRNGTVVARYRKFHPFDEDVDKTATPEFSTFTTDFGVTFGLITCFDILFKSPAIDLVQQKNINHIIFPTFWFGELPFLTAIQMQAGWSYAMNATLLASGGSLPIIGTTGSGIFLGRRPGTFRMFERNKNIMISRKIPVDGAEAHSDEKFYSESSTGIWGLKLIEDPSIPSSVGKNLEFDAVNFDEEICHNQFCCRFKAQYRAFNEKNGEHYTYRALAYNGERNFGKTTKGKVAYCAIVLCSNGNCAKKPYNKDFPVAFDHIKISADFDKGTFQMPSNLIWKDDVEDVLFETMDYSSFKFEKNEKDDKENVSLELIKPHAANIITFSIFGRIFDD